MRRTIEERMKNAAVGIPPHGGARWQTRWQKLFWFFLENPLVFSENLLSPSENMRRVEGLFIGNQGVKGNNSSAFALMMASLKVPVDNCSEKMESPNRLYHLITLQGSQ